ncbi:MAG: hypothetical protein QOI80_401 [Solirubrobacteraceae bacterium]|nr:hypothetical protein [Solirubrobacteraceae bacterium]
MTGLIALVAVLAAAGPPPPVTGIAPPPAFLRAEAGGVWMQQGSYCWMRAGKGVCVDFAGFADAPVIRLREGETITISLGFRPAHAGLTADDRTYRLRPARTLRWRVRGHPGVVAVFLRPALGGDAGYGVRTR